MSVVKGTCIKDTTCSPYDTNLDIFVGGSPSGASGATRDGITLLSGSSKVHINHDQLQWEVYGHTTMANHPASHV